MTFGLPHIDRRGRSRFCRATGWGALVAALAVVPLSGPVRARDASPATAAPPAIRDLSARFHPVVGRGGMVASQEALATRVGVEVLRDGGNAVDAAVAVSFALAVTLPRAGNVGGGGFMIIHRAADREVTALDYRETAPAAAGRDMFLDGEGNHDPGLSERGPLSVGVPGTVRGLALAHERFGSVPWGELLEPAIRLAEDGFPLTHEFADSLVAYQTDLKRSPAAAAVFFKEDGSPYAAGETWKQPDLAGTLRRIAKEGAEAFYTGEIAERIVAEIGRWGGAMTREDLASYQAKERATVSGLYRGFEIHSMPPPSAGGTLLVQMLAALEAAHPDGDLPAAGSAARIHLLAEIMRRSYADRARSFGDPDFVDVPVERLVSGEHVSRLVAGIDRARATPSTEIGDPSLRPQGTEGPETTHFSVIDAAGNAVSCTTTLNFSYGSRHMVPGTGILLNNEMDDFSAKPGAPNAYGAIGGEANAVAPGKRMLSSMTPVIVLKDGRPWLATGSPGGTRITTSVLQVISNMIDARMNLAEAVAAPRMHHQWFPDRIECEEGISPDTIRLLEAMGHRTVRSSAIGAVESVVWSESEQLFAGFADPRRPDGSAEPVRP